MEKVNANAVHFTASDGMVFVNETTHSVKKYLMVGKSLEDTLFERWREVTFKESIELQSVWDKEKFEFLCLMYKSSEKACFNPFTFGYAIIALKCSQKVARSGWNGKGMHLILIGGIDNATGDDGFGGFSVAFHELEERASILPFIAMKTVQGDYVPWLASQTDMLSEDWELVE